VTDEMLSHRRKLLELRARFLKIVFADIAQAGVNRGDDALEGLAFGNADDRYASAGTSAPGELLVDLTNERLVTIRDYTADAAGAMSVRGPGRRMQ